MTWLFISLILTNNYLLFGSDGLKSKWLKIEIGNTGNLLNSFMIVNFTCFKVETIHVIWAIVNFYIGK